MFILSEGLKLQAQVIPPASSHETRGVVLVHPHPLHGGHMYTKIIDRLFKKISSHGFGVLRFNFRGTQKSEGTFTGGEGELKDLEAAVEFATEHFGERPQTLVGYSFGAAMASVYASLYDIEQVHLIAPPVGHFTHIPKLSTEVSLYAAQKDELFSLEQTQQWFEALANKKRWVEIENADHCFKGHTVKLIESVVEGVTSSFKRGM